VGVDDEAYVYVTTTGRISGQPRTIEIWFVRHRDCIYILAEHFERAHWVKNIRKNARVGLRLASREVSARARVLDADRDSDTWKTVQDLAKQKYGWGDGLPVEIRPDSPLGDG
jgi:deazaflavin-dependent oxidoreductase (nitroreductase family)